jgi:hypothetical protein
VQKRKENQSLQKIIDQWENYFLQEEYDEADEEYPVDDQNIM